MLRSSHRRKEPFSRAAEERRGQAEKEGPNLPLSPQEQESVEQRLASLGVEDGGVVSEQKLNGLG